MSEEGRAHFDDNRTVLVGAVNFLEIVDFVDDIVVEAGLAETAHMLALAHLDVFVLLDLLLADQTNN